MATWCIVTSGNWFERQEKQGLTACTSIFGVLHIDHAGECAMNCWLIQVVPQFMAQTAGTGFCVTAPVTPNGTKVLENGWMGISSCCFSSFCPPQEPRPAQGFFPVEGFFLSFLGSGQPPTTHNLTILIVTDAI